MYNFHPDYNPRKLLRYSHDHWEKENIEFDWPPFMKENETDITITPPTLPVDITSGETFSASHIYSDLYNADKAFDDVTTGYGWLTSDGNVTDEWIKVDFGAADTKTIKRVRMQPTFRIKYPERCPRYWKLQGSNNDADWTTIAATGWNAFCKVYNTEEVESEKIANYDDWVDVTFTNAVAYRYYRIWFHDNWGDSYLGVNEIEMYEDEGDIYTASAPIFTSDHIGSYWLIKYPRTADEVNSPSTVRKEFTASGQTSDWLKDVLGSGHFRTEGSWTGRIILERSYDKGKTCHSLGDVSESSVEGDATGQNFNIGFNEEAGDAYYRMRAITIGGATTCIANLSVERYYHYGIIKVTDFTDSTHITAMEIRDVQPSAATRTTYAFVDSDPDTITDSSSNFLNDGFAIGQRIVVAGSTSNDGTYTIAGVVAGTITLVDTDTLTAEAAGDTVTISVPTKLWSEGAWSDERGYPGCATFHEERLMCGGTVHEPHRLDGSKTDDWENFRIGTLDDDAVSYFIAASEMNEIRWLISKEILLLGTAKAEWKLGSFDADEALTPGNPIKPRPQTSYGSKNIQAILLANVVLFVQQEGRVVRGAQYMFEKGESGGYDAFDYTTYAEHITESGIVGIAYQQQPEPILWAWLDNGKAIGMTFEPGQKVWGWFPLITDGDIESMGVIPGVDEDEVWCIVKRTKADGTVIRCIEYMKPRDWGDDQKDCFFVDSGLTFDGGDAVTITGITKADPAVVTAASHGFSDGDQVRIRNVGGMSEVNNKVFSVSNPATDTFELRNKLDTVDIDSTAFTIFAASVTGDTTYGSEDIKNVSAADIAKLSLLAPITGAGIPDGTTVTAIKDDWFTMSAEATITDTDVTITIGGTVEQVDNAFSGLDHLEGRTVSVLGDGSVHPDVVVTSGVITLTEYFNKVHAGLPYDSDLMPMKPEIQTQSGTLRSKVKRIYQTVFSFHKSLGCTYGSLDDDDVADITETIPFRKMTDPMGKPPPLFTGEKIVIFPGEYGLEGNVFVRQSQPLPLTVRSIVSRMEIHG